MCLSEGLCLMMLKLGGPWHKSQQLTQLQPVSEAHAACTFLWDQQHGLFSKWLGSLWSIDLLNFVWLPSVSYIWNRMTWRTSEVKPRRWTVTCIWYWGLKVKLPQCESNFTRSWLPCEVKSASVWWVRFWRAGIFHMESFYAKLPNKKKPWPKRTETPKTPRLRAGEAQTWTAWKKVPEGKQVTNFCLTVGTVCCMWTRAINFWFTNKLDLLSVAHEEVQLNSKMNNLTQSQIDSASFRSEMFLCMSFDSAPSF